MNSKSSGSWLEAFFTGKGFYIVLLLCAAVIGVSAWMLAAGNGTMAEDVIEVSNTTTGAGRTEMILPPKRDDSQTLEEIIQESTQVFQEPEVQEEPVEEVFQEEPAPVNPLYAWPLSGEVARFHDPDTLRYDETMGDWRTHEGIDILAPLGETVLAAHAGRVESVRKDDFLGTVVTVSHGDGFCTVYANLAEETAVSVGDWVEPGSVIGTVGATALAEVSEQAHLHFGVLRNGVNQNPLDYLPA